MRSMTQKFLYLIPRSEYGGLWNVIAESNEECFDLISNRWEYQGYEECFGRLRENIINAPKFSLVENEESRVVEAFTT